jgi:ELP3 family radical SAM enzyme/protein acetyltransferase
MSVDIEDLIKFNDVNLNTSFNEEFCITLFTKLHNDIDLFTDEDSFEYIKNKIQKSIKGLFRSHRIQMSKVEMMYAYQCLVQAKKIENRDFLKQFLIKKPANDISGINQITILTSPTPDGQDFSCKHDCFYCPNEPAHEGNNWTPQPRSYLSKEPAVQRANRNKFDPILQTQNRLDSLLKCGHKCDKLEFILEGGTFTEYPKPYLKRFFTEFIYTCNTYFDVQPKREMKSLAEEIMINKTTKCKIIGICIETRPDAVLENDEDGIPWVDTLLLWGVTRIQIGVQHTDNFILKKVNRGHNIDQVKRCIEVLKNNCFKIDIHLMPDLPHSSPEKDKEMFDTIYGSEEFQPDQIKIYPCEVVPWTKIEKWYNEGTYVPYGNDHKLIQDVLEYGMMKCPPWIRLPRVIRDIPHTYINGGVKCGNMRQLINDNIKDNNNHSMDIRFREIGRHPNYTIHDATLFVRTFKASHGTEYFISFETPDKKAIYGFTRLRIIENNRDNTFLNNYGLIRELHVYGSVQRVLRKNENDNSTQHKGLGRQLIKKAEEIAYNHNMNGTIVISGIGVRGYYEKMGYYLENNFMKKRFVFNRPFVNYIILIILSIIIRKMTDLFS